MQGARGKNMSKSNWLHTTDYHNCPYTYVSGGYGDLFCIQGRVMVDGSMCKNCGLINEPNPYPKNRIYPDGYYNPKCPDCGTDSVWLGWYVCPKCDRKIKHDPFKDGKKHMDKMVDDIYKRLKQRWF